MKMSFTSLEEAWNLKPSSNSTNPSSRQSSLSSPSINKMRGKQIKNERWRNYLNSIHSDEDKMVRQHNTNYQYGKNMGNTADLDTNSDADSDDIESSDTVSVDSDIDMRMYGNMKMPPQHNYHMSTERPKNVEHFDNGGDVSADCSSHLQHFIDCPRCNKMIRQRIEAFMNLEKKDAKMMRAMRKNYGGDDPLSASFYPKLDQGQLYINPGTANPVKIREGFNEEEEDNNSVDGEEMREHFGMAENKWWNSIGEIFLLIFIGVVFIYLMDLFVNMGMKWKK